MAGVGFRQGLFFDESRPHWREDGPRPMAWSAWYPTDKEAGPDPQFLGPPEAPWFTVPAAVQDAPPASSGRRFPIVLLSHGTGGTTDSLWWLAHRLAEAGFVAVGVNHHGNTAMEPYLPEGFLCWWERARDLSVLFDHVTQDTSSLAPIVDTRRVHAAGFSLGGYTVLAAMGAVTDLELFSAWQRTANMGSGPAEFPDLGEQIPKLMETSATYRDSVARAGDDYRDDRIRSGFLMAPAPPVRGFLPRSIAKITAPVSMVSGAQDREAPLEVGGAWLQSINATFGLTVYPGPVGHYVFMPLATEEGKAAMPSLCVDEQSVDRGAIHAATAESAIEHFRGADTAP